MKLISLLVLFLSLSSVVFSQVNDTLRIKRPDPILQSLAGGLVYSASFFLLNGNEILHHFDSLAKNTESGVGFTLVFSSLLASGAIAVVGDLTASRNGGSYLTAFTVDWMVSSFGAAAVNAIYTGKDPTLRFILTLVPSVGILVFMNQMYFDSEMKFSQTGNLLNKFSPLIGSKFFGLYYHSAF